MKPTAVGFISLTTVMLNEYQDTAMAFRLVRTVRKHTVQNSGTVLSPLIRSWWRHQMETFSASLDLCEGNSPVTCEFPSQRPVTRSFDFNLNLRLNKNGWKKHRDAGDLRCHRAHYDGTVMWFLFIRRGLCVLSPNVRCASICSHAWSGRSNPDFKSILSLEWISFCFQSSVWILWKTT